MNLYYFSWTILIAVSLWVSLAGFFWAMRHGQFDEQERARYLPLRGQEAPTPQSKSKGAMREIYLLIGILLLGAAGLVAAALTMFLTSRGKVL